MSTDPPVSNSIWTRRLLIALTIVAWIAIICFVFFLIWLVGESFILVLIGGLLAYIIYPFVLLFQRIMPRPLAVVLVYLISLIFGRCFLRSAISSTHNHHYPSFESCWSASITPFPGCFATDWHLKRSVYRIRQRPHWTTTRPAQRRASVCRRNIHLDYLCDHYCNTQCLFHSRRFTHHKLATCEDTTEI